MPGTTDPVYMGRGTSLGIGVEVTWGTAAARTNWLRIISASLATKEMYQDVPTLGTNGGVSANSRRRFLSAAESGGDIEWIGSYDDSTILLVKNALGGATDAGAGPYTHTLKLAKDLGEGLTLELIRGELVAGTAISEVFEGCMVNSLELSWKTGDVMRCKASIMAETSAARGAAGSPTYTTGGEPIIGWQSGDLTWNSVARKVRELTITIDNALERRPALGTTTTLRPQRSGETNVRVRAVLEILTGDALFTAHLAQTQADGSITFTSGAKSLAIAMHQAEIDSVSDPISSQGVLTQTVEWRCLSDGTDEGIQLTWTNASALHSAN